MRILKIIHGYPPLYNGGSEVYSQLLCLELVKQHEVHVFTREENPFAEDFSMQTRQDHLNPQIKLHVINIPLEKYRYRFSHPLADAQLTKLLNEVKPDIVHIGHLNHLSTSIIYQIKNKNIPIVYTLHDYWLMCPRGQFIQRNSSAPEELWNLCDGQNDQKCAEKCYSGYITGLSNEQEQDISYWTNWVKRRMDHMRNIIRHVDLFVAPAKYLYQRYVNDFKLPKDKIIYLDYGFDLKRLSGRNRSPDALFTFGYIGTHIPAKGIQHLIEAFGKVNGNCQLKIWGRYRPQNTDGLKAIAAKLPETKQRNIHWLHEYANESIITDVFNHTDCIVVPSIWVENSPLVIHEALQARAAVITADTGGMSEYIHHMENGLLFKHRNVASLAEQMQKFIDNPTLATTLGARGYIQSTDGNIACIEEQAHFFNKTYQKLIESKGNDHVDQNRTVADNV